MESKGHLLPGDGQPSQSDLGWPRKAGSHWLSSGISSVQKMLENTSAMHPVPKDRFQHQQK